MSLLVWLPLLGNLNNQGIANVTVTNNGASVDNNGKLGKCYSFNGSSNYINISNLPNPANLTVSFWMLRSANTGTRQFMFTAWTGVTCELTTDNKIVCTCYGNGANQGSCTYTDQAITTSSGWVHVTYTFEDKVGGKLYVNGNLVKSTASSQSIAWGTTSGKIGYYSTYFNGKINDFRFYDEVLSAKQIREIAKGLVAHYPLDDIYGVSNLIVNGFGENGTEGWANSNYTTSQKPSSPTTIKGSYYSNETSQYTPIISGHSYTISMQLKAPSASGTTYPSIIPYDIDKNFINVYNCTEGFGSSYKTTLKKALKKGDTIIYANDLSAWTTAENYYYHVAIFGYKDSTGYTWPDMIYTADSPVFGTKTNKSNINKTNNTITLSSAYTGADRPAGTTICQATEGSTYYYPFGGISYSSIQDWTSKSATFIPDNTNRLKAMKYLRWKCYDGVYTAGISLVDNTDKNVIRDTSGYGYNGTSSGNINTSLKTSRYNKSTNFDGVDSVIKIPFNTMLGSATSTDYTISVWTYKTTIGTKNYQTILGGPSGFELEARNSDNTSPLYRIHNWGGGTTAYEFNKWNLFTFVHTTTDSKLYVNGVLKITGTTQTIPSGDYFIGAWKTATQQNYEGLMSDFRIYATALSANDVKELYQTSASIDNKGNIYSLEFKEV